MRPIDADWFKKLVLSKKEIDPYIVGVMINAIDAMPTIEERKNMKTSEEYLAEYVRENRPEIEKSIDYIFWKLVRQFRDIIHDTCKMINDLAPDELKQMLLKVEDNEDDLKECEEQTSDMGNET